MMEHIKNVGEMKCSRCGIELPIFDERGQHNFCPASASAGEIVNLCMKCKMDDIAEHRKKQ